MDVDLTKAQLLWLETTKIKQLGKNRGILKPSWALVEIDQLGVFNGWRFNY
jgi:hypothetical protein